MKKSKFTDNPYIESFNGMPRAECLNQHWFEMLSEARQESRPGEWITMSGGRTPL
jgi:hypothetical protein